MRAFTVIQNGTQITNRGGGGPLNTLYKKKAIFYTVQLKINSGPFSFRLHYEYCIWFWLGIIYATFIAAVAFAAYSRGPNNVPLFLTWQIVCVFFCFLKSFAIELTWHLRSAGQSHRCSSLRAQYLMRFLRFHTTFLCCLFLFFVSLLLYALHSKGCISEF